MGGGGSVPSTPLECMLKGFDTYFNHSDYKPPRPRATKERLRFLCQQQWPHLGVGWPPEGTFKDQIIDDVWGKIVVNEEQYPNQLQYIEAWENAVAEKPGELLQCQAEMVRLCVARPRKEKAKNTLSKGGTAKGIVKRQEPKVSDSKKKVLGQAEEEIIRPPPYAQVSPPVDNAQMAAAAALSDDEEGEAVGPAKREGGGEGMAYGAGRERGAGAIDRIQTRAVTARAEAAREEAAKLEETQRDFMAPLRQMDQQVVNAQTGDLEYRPCFQYVPFSTTDLLNWKQHYGPLSVKPTELADLFQTIMQTHNPNWQDIQQLLSTLLTPEEREKWRAAVRTHIKERFPNEQDLGPRMAEFAPEQNPGWDPTDPAHRTALREYQNVTVIALRKAGKPPVNMSKPSLVMQGSEESPESFLQRLIEAYEMYTQVNPRSEDNVRMLNERFIAQSYEDIRKKLQKLEGALGKNTTELLEVARKVFVNRDKVEKKEKDARMHKKAELLAVALQGRAGFPGRTGFQGRAGFQGRVGLGPNQCAICKLEGHWKWECPQGARWGQSEWRRPFGRPFGGRGQGMGHGGPPRFPYRGGNAQGNPIGGGATGLAGVAPENAAQVEGIGLAGTGWTA
ncbi:uncharacterized protein [Erythrolamprus reginae]|uniref:uncharacterized protein n=1 Tax=Erythrolamprus reginae TaxID=121349 RepID=UPI00396C9625